FYSSTFLSLLHRALGTFRTPHSQFVQPIDDLASGVQSTRLVAPHMSAFGGKADIAIKRMTFALDSKEFIGLTLRSRDASNGHCGNNRCGGLAMLPEHRALLEDEPCPLPDEVLGEMYRANAHGLNELIATISPAARVLL